jgi:hypothetical protein
MLPVIAGVVSDFFILSVLFDIGTGVVGLKN